MNRRSPMTAQTLIAIDPRTGSRMQQRAAPRTDRGGNVALAD
jgi:hypothetical protein